MKYNKIFIFFLLCSIGFHLKADSIPSGFMRAPLWRIGAEASAAWVPATNRFLNGSNPSGSRINFNPAADIRADFSFNPSTKEGMLYHGLYQGIGVSVNSFLHEQLLGTPVSLYVYQGAPFARLGHKTTLGYEWQFGAAMGWHHYEKETAEYNSAIGTYVTAQLGVGLKLYHSLTKRVELTVGVGVKHFSNGNTSWPNAGVNSVGATLGVAYRLYDSKAFSQPQAYLEAEADRHRWMYDVTIFGAWRRRVITVGQPEEAQLCPGKFGVLGVAFSPLYILNRWIAVGPSADFLWDESAGLKPYWVPGSYKDNLKFERPSFGKQFSAALSVHAELTMPIFSVNGGVGVNLIAPHGEKRFYQSLTLKTFITDFLYINTGYRIGDFKDPQNLMLGVGYRFR